MKFHYEFDIPRLEPPLTHRDKLLLIGSCFTENMGEKLRRYKFGVLENPQGILFNPVSVAEALTACIENRHWTEADLFSYNEAWHSWKHHSRFSAPHPAQALEKMNAATTAAHGFLKEAGSVLITLGSSWVYTLTEAAAGNSSGAVAANNHKAPANWFRRRLLRYEEVLEVLDPIIHRLFLFNPGLRILFTISPVRHLREGVVDNNRSKAVLIQAVHHLVNKFDRLYYFPAYELVIDDLRDYRFYAEDLVHPNYAATEYVWEKFTAACLSEATRGLIAELHAIYLAFRHKPFHDASPAHLKFLQSFAARTRTLQQAHPYLDLAAETAYFETGDKA